MITGTEHRGMRKINTRDFQLATRTTVRDVNRQIVLNLIREHQPISRAELARRMDVPRGALTEIVRELIASDIVYESEGLPTGPGRPPVLLRVRTTGRLVVAADVRAERTSVALADFSGRVVARDVFPTPESPDALVETLAGHARRMLRSDDLSATPGTAACHGIGVVVPGMVDHRTGRVIYAPRLGWRGVELRRALEERLGLPVFVENASIACALARLWLSPEETRTVRSFAYVSISDGVGVGLVINGEVLRGELHTAGEFGHVSLDASGPECACGKRGCWEALVCNAATVERYATRVLRQRVGGSVRHVRWRQESARAVEEVVRRARRGEKAAVDAIAETGRQIGRGLALVVGAFSPGRIYVGGEITAAWSVMEAPLREALADGTPTDAGRRTPVVPDGNPAGYRELGAVALVAAPTYAAMEVG